MRRLLALSLAALLVGPLAGIAVAGEQQTYVRLPGGNFRSALRYEDIADAPLRVRPFALMRRPVTNAEFLAFVKTHPQWRRDRVATVRRSVEPTKQSIDVRVLANREHDRVRIERLPILHGSTEEPAKDVVLERDQ